MIQKAISATITATCRFGWLPLAIFFAHEVCAHVVDGYRLWPPVDIPLHFLGGLAIAFFISGTVRVFAERNLIRLPDTVVHLLLVFGLTCAAALFWEFAEWTADYILGTTCQLGLDDSFGDMLFGVLGGIVFIALLAFRMNRNDSANAPDGIRQPADGSLKPLA